MSKETWLDMTFKIADDAEFEAEQQPNGDIEYTFPIPECGSSRVTILVPAPVAKRINVKVREILAAGTTTAIAAALIG